MLAGGIGYVVRDRAARLVQTGQRVAEALAGARTAIDARDLTLAGQRVAEAQGRLGADGASLADLAAEIGGIQREINDRQADTARFYQFLKEASDAQDSMSLNRLGNARPEDHLGEKALGLYGVLTEKDWSSHLDRSYLTADQKQRVRETVYVTLVSLADYGVRWNRDPGTAARSLELLQRAQIFHQPTRAFYFVRAECRRQQGDRAAGAEDEKQFKAAVARTAWDHFLPGHTAGWRGDFDEAIRSYQAALGLQPNHYNSLFFLAMLLANKMKRPAEAVAYYTACIALRPGHFNAYCNRGICHRQLGHFDAAKADFAAALPLANSDQRRSTMLFAQADLMFAMGKHQEDQELLRQVIAIEEGLVAGSPDRPQYSDRYLMALGNLAESLATCPVSDLRNPAQAVELVRKVAGRAPKENVPWNALAMAYYRTGDWKTAISTLEKSVSLDPDQLHLALDGYFLAMAYWQLGQKDQARHWYDKASAWMVKHEPHDEQLVRFRAEAAVLLGVNLPTAEAGPEPAPETKGPPG
jgi:tetratricopeptide (TPR) repeat protein